MLDGKDLQSWEGAQCSKREESRKTDSSKTFLKSILPPMLIIWVNFPRTGKMVKMWQFFYLFFYSVVTNCFICSTFLNCSEEILPFRPMPDQKTMPR